MKKLTPFILAGCSLSLIVFPIRAQEGLELVAPREVREHRNELSSHGTGNPDTEMDIKSFKPAVRDSIPFSRPATAPQRKTEKQQSEDVLKFNFLYYIIQRFKFSDIIE